MKPVAVYPDAERLVVDFLRPLFSGAATVGVGVPNGWTPAAVPHVSVAQDGQLLDHPVVAHCTIRCTARAASTTQAKRLATLAQAHLLAVPDFACGAASLTGVLPARDPDTHAELASVTVRVSVRSQVLS